MIMKRVMFLLPLILLAGACRQDDASRLIRGDCYNQDLGETLPCGTFEVPENRGADAGRKIKLNFVILPAINAAPAPDPVFVFSGGPGQGAAQDVAAWAQELRELRREREIVLVDERGTGFSRPLPCTRSGDAQSAQTYLQDMFPEDYVRRCREELEGQNDLRCYHSAIFAADIDELRQALGYGRINLYGVSYGGSMALVYMKLFPDAVRSACLSFPAVPSALYPSTLAEDTQEVLERLFRDCASDPGCAGDYPSLQNEFYAILQRLGNGPVTTAITNPINGRPETVTFTYNLFIQGFRSLLYGAGGQSWAPAFIHWAYRGTYFPLVEETVRSLYNDQFSITDGMFLCVTCTEAIPFIDFAAARARAAGTFMGTYRLDQQQRACDLWVRSDLPAGFFDPPAAAIPTLILTGDIDPTIRPRVGEQLSRLLPNSVHFNVPNCGHGAGAAWEDCLDAAVLRFVSQGSVADLDFSCADGNRRPPWISWRDYSGAHAAKLREEIAARLRRDLAVKQDPAP